MKGHTSFSSRKALIQSFVFSLFLSLLNRPGHAFQLAEEANTAKFHTIMELGVHTPKVNIYSNIGSI